MANPLDFLQSIQLQETKTVNRVGGGGVKKHRLPAAGADLRIWKTGAVYPSQALVDLLNLEYTTRVADVPQGNALDIFKSTDYTAVQTPSPCIFVAAVPRSKPRTDLFSQVGYDEDQQPMSSVLEQGATTFGKATLLPMLKEVYDVEPNEEGWIDLSIVGKGAGFNEPYINSNGTQLYFIPKTVIRGEHEGTLTVVRREKLNVFVIVPAAFMGEVKRQELALTVEAKEAIAAVSTVDEGSAEEEVVDAPTDSNAAAALFVDQVTVAPDVVDAPVSNAIMHG